MNQQLKNNLILVGVIFALVMIGYYVMSPYQNCIRENPTAYTSWCNDRTAW